MDCDEPHLAWNEKTQPIQWTKWPTSALVAVGSLWPLVNNKGLISSSICTSGEIFPSLTFFQLHP
jgi:hypothetical protein